MRRGRTVQIKMNREYDKSALRKSDDKLFQTLVAAAAKVLSRKQVYVRWTVSVFESVERSCLARASVTSWQSLAKAKAYNTCIAPQVTYRDFRGAGTTQARADVQPVYAVRQAC